MGGWCAPVITISLIAGWGGRGPAPQEARPTRPEASAPRRETATGSLKGASEQVVAGPVLTLEGISREREGKTLRLRLFNKGAEPIWFSGYSPTYPRKRIDKLGRDGWKEWSTDWCGTGAGLHKVAAGQSAEFTFLMPVNPGPIRVGVCCRIDKAGERKTVWSRRIDLGR
jgi:hypothetical protein